MEGGKHRVGGSGVIVAQREQREKGRTGAQHRFVAAAADARSDDAAGAQDNAPVAVAVPSRLANQNPNITDM